MTNNEINRKNVSENVKNEDRTNGETKDAKKDSLVYLYDLDYILSTKEGQFAKFLAEGLNDMKNIRFYISVALEHSEKFLRNIYRQVKGVPDWKIKKTRGALFVYLTKRYEKLDNYEH